MRPKAKFIGNGKINTKRNCEWFKVIASEEQEIGGGKIPRGILKPSRTDSFKQCTFSL